MQELQTLIPAGARVCAAGETLVVAPLKVGQLPAFLRAIASVMGPITSGQVDWLALLGTHGDALLDAIAIAVDKPRAWVDALGADEAITLAAKVIEVNADFFTRTVLPQIEALFTQTRAIHTPQAGSTPPSA